MSTYATCPNHADQTFHKSSGDCSCGSRHRDWRDMSRELFDTTAPAAVLFDASPGMVPAPVDGAGTGDLLTLIGGDE